MISIEFVAFSLFLTSVVSSEGDGCIVRDTGKAERCISIHECEHAKKLLQSQQIPQRCGFNKETPLVCCASHHEPTPGVTSAEQCQKYNVRINVVDRPPILIEHLEEPLPKEFPHMAAVGFGDKNNISWLCLGSLISDRFVLAPAHCAKSFQLGPPKWIRLGDLNLDNKTKEANSQDIQISEIIKHPDFKLSSPYHDIALMKLEKAVTFDDYIQPACLHTEMDIPYNKLQTISWNLYDFFREPNNQLVITDLNVIKHETCAKWFLHGGRRLKDGILDELQLCAGHDVGKDGCLNDSGGPLQFQKKRGAQHYFVVVGLTSFGRGCGFENGAAVYTRISHYIGWIESVVWPPVPDA